jgi:transcriptional regulator with XRE-family HTH domain
MPPPLAGLVQAPIVHLEQTAGKGPQMSEIAKRIGSRIRQLRTQRPERMTQEDLAERAQISVSFLSMIERGERVAHLETLASLAEALDVTLSDLVAGTDSDAVDPTSLLLRPLCDFARARRLTARDVEKLLGVARAMFSGSSNHSGSA